MNHTFNHYIDQIKDQIIHSTCEIINIPSVLEVNDHSNTPFGLNTVKALEYFLNLGKNFGFKTKNIDNKCGYIECGEGEKLLGIIGHLDVVPADDSWTFNPFCATISQNNIYGRGAIDDKGPMIAALYAMKTVHDHFHLNKRVRLIIGLDEENNWQCIQRYKETEEIPTVSFSPDANFPCIYAEKTIETIYLKEKYTPNPSLYIESISTNNNAINVVPKYCEIIIGFDHYKIPDILSKIRQIIHQYHYKIQVNPIDFSHIKLIAEGISAHAAHPDLGDNAIAKLIIILNDLFHYYHIPLSLLEYFTTYIGDDFTGKKLGIDYQDESGSLTLNTAQFIYSHDTLSIGFNLRIPISMNYTNIEQAFKNNKNSNLDIEVKKIQEPLYIEKTNNLVQKLCAIFNDYYHSNLPPEAIGGGTYARAFENCISFGPQLPGAKDMCHQSDEYISIENLLFCTKVYAEAIYQL